MPPYYYNNSELHGKEAAIIHKTNSYVTRFARKGSYDYTATIVEVATQHLSLIIINANYYASV